MLRIFVQTVAFTVLAPGAATVLVPLWLHRASPVWAGRIGALRWAGLPLILIGATCYLLCVAEFLLRGRGTPAAWFTRPIRFLIGEEPAVMVRTALYGCVRNPMYLSVLSILVGEAILFASPRLLGWAVAAALFLHLTVVLLEEPHLRRRHGAAFEEYCRTTPRWLPKRKRMPPGPKAVH